MSSRKTFLKQISLGGATFFLAPGWEHLLSGADEWDVPPALQKEMYEAALQLAKSKIRGGPDDPVYKKPYVDAAFSSNIFLWDTCFIATYAKYHPDELPIANALDNFYDRQEPDGFIGREYTKEGKTMWPKGHPVSINPPLLAFAELELQSQRKDTDRLRSVYPKLKKQFDFLVRHYREKDNLFFSDALGSGMDNIPRYPEGWQDDGAGIRLNNLYPEIFEYKGPSAAWNRQGRSVDLSAQMALFARNMTEIATMLHREDEIAGYQKFYEETKDAINRHCWNGADGFYYDLSHGKQIPRKHVGMFWTLLAGIVPDKHLKRFLRHLTDPGQFWRKFPIASFPADQPGYDPDGGYWLGGNWAPTTYMVIRGLQHCGKQALAKKLARQYYWCVAQVYKETGTFWENYAPDQLKPGNPARKDFCGWTGLAPIALYYEFIKK